MLFGLEKPWEFFFFFFLFKNSRFHRPHLHINKCYKSDFALAPFSVVVWKLPNNSARKTPILQTGLVVPTESGSAKAWPANVRGKVKGAQEREYLCPSTPLALLHLCWECSPQFRVLLKSVESPVGKTPLVFSHPPCSSDGKESACNAGDGGSIPGSGRPPGKGNGNPLQYSCLKNLHGQRSLAVYSPWGRKELDITKRLSHVQSTHVRTQAWILLGA